MGALGVGIIYNGVLDAMLEQAPEAVDYVSVIPERFWVDRGRGARPRFTRPPGPRGILEGLHGRYPLVAHGLGLSIASSALFDLSHVRALARLHREYGFRWISEHLVAVRVATGSSDDHHAGVQIPMPWDHNFLRMLVTRVDRVQQILGMPLLLENGVEFTPVPDPDMSEAEFIHELHHRTGCGLLLDLHNLYVNQQNLGVNPYRYLEAIPAGAVREIHVAGGDRMYGAYLDSHAGAPPPEVWDLLEQAMARCPGIDGITFEFHESYLPRLGEAGVLAEMRKLRSAWERYRSIQDVVA